MKADATVLHDLRAAERGIDNLTALESDEQIEALAMALAFLIRGVRTACEVDEPAVTARDATRATQEESA